MTRLGGIRNNGAGGNNVGSRGGVGRQAVNLRDLGEEEQRAYELLDALKNLDPAGRKTVLAKAGAGEPVSAHGLKRVASMYSSMGMPLNGRGITRFKADRNLPTSAGLANAFVARAYVRALEGNEIIIRVERNEEQTLRPSERAMLDFLRDMQKKRGADTLRPVKELLGLGNPQLPRAVEALANEYVGLHTVKQIAHATTMREIPLTPDGWRKLVEKLEKESQ